MFGTPADEGIKRVCRLRGGEEPDTGISFDVVFFVPGTLFEADFKGVRTGSLSRKQRMLQIQIALPADINEKSVDEASALILASLEEGVSVGIERLRKVKTDFNEQAMLSFLGRMKARAVN